MARLGSRSAQTSSCRRACAELARWQVMGCHMGQRGVDKPVVRYVTGEVAQAAHEALRTREMLQ